MDCLEVGWSRLGLATLYSWSPLHTCLFLLGPADKLGHALLVKAEVQRPAQPLSVSQASAWVMFAYCLLAKASKMAKPKVKESTVWLWWEGLKSHMVNSMGYVEWGELGPLSQHTPGGNGEIEKNLSSVATLPLSHQVPSKKHKIGGNLLGLSLALDVSCSQSIVLKDLPLLYN